MCCFSVVIEAERSIVDFESSFFVHNFHCCNMLGGGGLHTFLYKVLEERLLFQCIFQLGIRIPPSIHTKEFG